MVETKTPICAFGTPAENFKLPDPLGKTYQLADCRGEKGLLVMFICNHCPFVKAILSRLVEDSRKLIEQGVGVVAIMSNDTINYPDDSPENMQHLAKEMDFPFPYLFDQTQAVAKAFGAVCTPDFFGYNADLQLQYRGRFDDTGRGQPSASTQHELLAAMTQVADTGKGPKEQLVSIGCSIKWAD